MISSTKPIIIRPQTGLMDMRSDPAEIGAGNFRVSLNMACREQGKLCRSGGWVKLFSDSPNGFTNQDLHDQLVTLQDYREVIEGTFTIPPHIVDYQSLYFTGPGYGDDGLGYGYGPSLPIFAPGTSYGYETCGGYFTRSGCNESISYLSEVSSESGSRRLLAGTRSRLYELDEQTGNWRILADGLGGFYRNTSNSNCEPCTETRLQSDSLLGYTIFTNNFDVPFSYRFGDAITGCKMSAVRPIEDMAALGVTRVGCVCQFKGFMLYADVDMDGNSYPGRILWSDFNDPLSVIPLPGTSLANFSDIAFSERILRMKVLGDYLMIYTDKGIHRGTLVLRQESSGVVSEVFNFKQIYAGPDALKYKHTLVDTGAAHFFASANGIYVMTANDIRPRRVEWIHKASGAIYNGAAEYASEFQSLPSEISTKIAFGRLNEERCHQFIGGYNSFNKEVFFSWPTDDNTCPNVTLRLNVQYETASLIDHGFTAFCSYRPDGRPSLRHWLISIGACTPDNFDFVKEGPPGSDPIPPDEMPLYIWNEDEDPSLPAHARSICAQLGNMTMSDICNGCTTGPVFIAGSAADLCLKEFRDDVFLREEFAGLGGYTERGYASFVQSGGIDFGTEVDKVINRATLEYRALPQTVPSTVTFMVGFGPQASCPTWRSVGQRPLKCLTDKTRQQHEALHTRPSLDANFPTFYRGKFISYRYWTLGTGGGSCYSKLELDVRNAQSRV